MKGVLLWVLLWVLRWVLLRGLALGLAAGSCGGSCDWVRWMVVADEYDNVRVLSLGSCRWGLVGDIARKFM